MLRDTPPLEERSKKRVGKGGKKNKRGKKKQGAQKKRIVRELEEISEVQDDFDSIMDSQQSERGPQLDYNWLSRLQKERDQRSQQDDKLSVKTKSTTMSAGT